MEARCQWIARAAEEDLGMSQLAAQHSLNTMCNIPGEELDPWDSIKQESTHTEETFTKALEEKTY